MPRIIADYKNQAKKLIIQAGLNSFLRRGYRSTTMAEIAKEVGVTKGDLYHYFPSKAALLREVGLTVRYDAVQPLMKDSDKTKPVEALLSVFELALNDDPGAKLFFDLLAESSGDPKMEDSIKLQNREYVKAVKTVLDMLPKSSWSTSVSSTSEDVALSIMFLYLGAGVYAKLGVPHDEIQRALKEGLKSILGK